MSKPIKPPRAINPEKRINDIYTPALPNHQDKSITTSDIGFLATNTVRSKRVISKEEVTSGMPPREDAIEKITQEGSLIQEIATQIILEEEEKRRRENPATLTPEGIRNLMETLILDHEQKHKGGMPLSHCTDQSKNSIIHILTQEICQLIIGPKFSQEYNLKDRDAITRAYREMINFFINQNPLLANAVNNQKLTAFDLYQNIIQGHEKKLKQYEKEWRLELETLRKLTKKKPQEAPQKPEESADLQDLQVLIKLKQEELEELQKLHKSELQDFKEWQEERALEEMQKLTQNLQNLTKTIKENPKISTEETEELHELQKSELKKLQEIQKLDDINQIKELKSLQKSKRQDLEKEIEILELTQQELEEIREQEEVKKQKELTSSLRKQIEKTQKAREKVSKHTIPKHDQDLLDSIRETLEQAKELSLRSTQREVWSYEDLMFYYSLIQDLTNLDISKNNQPEEAVREVLLSKISEYENKEQQNKFLDHFASATVCIPYAKNETLLHELFNLTLHFSKNQECRQSRHNAIKLLNLILIIAIHKPSLLDQVNSDRLTPIDNFRNKLPPELSQKTTEGLNTAIKNIQQRVEEAKLMKYKAMMIPLSKRTATVTQNTPTQNEGAPRIATLITALKKTEALDPKPKRIYRDPKTGITVSTKMLPQKIPTQEELERDKKDMKKLQIEKLQLQLEKFQLQQLALKLGKIPEKKKPGELGELEENIEFEQEFKLLIDKWEKLQNEIKGASQQLKSQIEKLRDEMNPFSPQNKSNNAGQSPQPKKDFNPFAPNPHFTSQEIDYCTKTLPQEPDLKKAIQENCKGLVKKTSLANETILHILSPTACSKILYAKNESDFKKAGKLLEIIKIFIEEDSILNHTPNDESKTPYALCYELYQKYKARHPEGLNQEKEKLIDTLNKAIRPIIKQETVANDSYATAHRTLPKKPIQETHHRRKLPKPPGPAPAPQSTEQASSSKLGRE